MSAWRIGLESPEPAAAPATPAEARSAGSARGGRDPRRRETLASQPSWIGSQVDAGDTLAIYVPGVTAIAASGGKPSVLLLVVMIVATPLFVLGGAFSAGKPVDRVVLTSAGLGTAAFAIWSLSVPLSGWQRWGLIADNDGSVAIGAGIVGVLFGQLADGIVKRFTPA